MDKLKKLILNSGIASQLQKNILAKKHIEVRGPDGSGAAVIVSALMEVLDLPGLVICPGVQYCEEFTEDAAIFNPETACYFPALETVKETSDKNCPINSYNDTETSRLKVLRHLLFGTDERLSNAADWFEPMPATRLVCAPVNAILQAVPPPEDIQKRSIHLKKGDMLSPYEIVEWLVEKHFISSAQTETPGHYSLRGGILDVFSYGSPVPVRIEFFGDEIDSIRMFDPGLQTSRKQVKDCRIMAPSAYDHAGTDKSTNPVSEHKKTILDYLPPDAPVFLAEPDEIWKRGEELAAEERHAGTVFTPSEIKSAIDSRPCIMFDSDGDTKGSEVISMPYKQRDIFGVDLKSMSLELRRIADKNSTYILHTNLAEKERLNDLLEEQKIQTGDLTYSPGRLNHGVIFLSESLAIIPHHRIFGRYSFRRRLKRSERAAPVSSADQLRPGDYIVHIKHGIGRFHGLEMIEKHGRQREHLVVEFADKVKIFVPADRLESVHRYVGIGGRKPSLSKIRGSSWEKTRDKAQKAAEDLAAELLRLQAARMTKPGITYPPDDGWQRQFEAEFPYEETQDQLNAVSDVKSDMKASRPMDRLICGDVGYGKTEIAMRAAFKAAVSGKQVAVVAPTTVLAQQHLRTFNERMADYPVEIRMLSRFISPGEARATIEALSAGKIDIVIGTHRLFQKDVSFKNLGLLIIDEEQRFGVKHKERLKKLRTSLDILTLTATPIPRTLHMAMMGLRDISALQTAPVSRRAIETHVGRWDDGLVRDAILREINREGQVYLVHNRVRTIEKTAERIRRLVPEARTASVHGQMPEKKLSETMEAFCKGEFDVIVSTTIIENGLDIPNANTLIIDRAELLGLSEMHQLRGRVGRYIHKAYAFFLTPENRPIPPEARERLETIRRYSDLGAGFDIALRDLEMRGGGNLLGAEQSGHIAAVGYNLYCKMLSRAQNHLKGQKTQDLPDTIVDLGLEAFLGQDYMPALEHRIDIYRRLASAVTPEKVKKIETAVEDRFGTLPEPAINLLLETEIKVLGHAAGLESIELKNGSLYLKGKDLEKFYARLPQETGRLRPVRDGILEVRLSKKESTKQEIFKLLKRLLSEDT